MTHNNLWKVKIIDQGFTFNRDVYIYREVPNGMEVVQGDTIQFVNRGEAVPTKPSMTLMPEMLQALVEGLAENGYKPEQGFTQGKLEATEKHLEDMRTLVFKDWNKQAEDLMQG